MRITDFPTELLSNICTQLDSLEDWKTFSSVCKLFNSIGSIEEVWKGRIRNDFRLLSYFSNNSPVFRRRGFKQLYRALLNPQVFVWGQATNGRLGVPDEELSRYNARFDQLHYPYWLKSMSNLGVSQITCGGYMMLALTHRNDLYFWGTFEGSSYQMPYSKQEDVPVKLEIFPNNTLIHQVAAGRAHALALSEEGQVFHFSNPEDTATKVFFENTSSKIVQIACGFYTCLALTQSHEILFWNHSFCKVPKSFRKLIFSELNEDEHFVKVAGGDKYALASTNQGRVVYWEIGQIGDQYHLLKLDSPPVQNFNLQCSTEFEGNLIMSVSNLNIIHLTAQFRNFSLFDDNGHIWLGEVNTENEENHQVDIQIKEGPQFDKGQAIQASFGDWHSAILVDDGRLFTYGQHAHGHGQPDSNELVQEDGRVDSPHQVDYFGPNYFVFSVACAGWHTAALAVDLSIPPASESPAYPQAPSEPYSHRIYRPRPGMTFQAVDINGEFHPFNEDE